MLREVSADSSQFAQHRWFSRLSNPIFPIAAIVLAALVGIPLFWIFVYALSDASGAFSLANIVKLVTDPAFRGPLATSLVVASSVAVLCVGVSLPLAWLTSRTDMPLARMIRILVLACYVVPPFLGAIAWELLAAPNKGFINQAARSIFGMNQFDYVVNIYSVSGLIFVDTCYTFAFAFTLIATALDRVPNEYEEASAIFGARRVPTLTRVTFPLIFPAIIASALVAFLHSITLFGTPAILALPAGFHTLTTRIWSLFSYPTDEHLASAAALPLLVITVCLLWMQARLIGRRSYTVVGGKNGRVAPMQLGRWRWPALVLSLAFLSLPIFLPLFALLRAAFTKDIGFASGISDLTLDHFRFVFFSLSGMRQAFSNTIILGFVTATVGTAFGFIIAYIVNRKTVPGAGVIGFIAVAPSAIPSIVLAVGLFIAYTRPPLQLYGTLALLALAFVTLELPAAYQQMRAALRAMHPELEDAGRIFGASQLGAIRVITAPILRNSLIATWCIVFVGAIRELSAAILLFTADTKVLSVFIYDLHESGQMGAIAVLGLVLLGMTIAIVALANKIGGANKVSG